MTWGAGLLVLWALDVGLWKLGSGSWAFGFRKLIDIPCLNDKQRVSTGLFVIKLTCAVITVCLSFAQACEPKPCQEPHSRSTHTESTMNLTLPFADLPSHRLCAAAQVMCGATVDAMAITSFAAFTDGAPPGALKNRRSSA